MKTTTEKIFLPHHSNGKFEGENVCLFNWSLKTDACLHTTRNQQKGTISLEPLEGNKI
jgi:hypothetical protein